MRHEDYISSLFEERKSTVEATVEVKPRIDIKSIDMEVNVKVIKAEEETRYVSDFYPYGCLIPHGNIDLIQCGTGKGKTYWSTHDFLEEAEKCKYNILLLVPRKMIMQQIVSEKLPKGEDYVYNNGVYHIKNLTVCTYHKFYKELEKKGLNTIFGKQYRAIIFDEAHVILEDASFSEAANFVLDAMFDFFGTKVSYYFLSATMKHVERIIYEAGCKKLRRLDMTYMGIVENPPTFRKFVFPNTYEKYNVRYLDSENEIEELYNELTDREKMLIFVSSKETGEELKELLPDSEFLFAESDEDKLSAEAQKEYAKIKEKASFDCKALITTKLLDAGVNFKMQELRHIVIHIEGGEDEFIQIIGRKRRIDNSSVNLYIMKMNPEYFLMRRYMCIEKLMVLQEFAYCNRCISRCRGNYKKFGTQLIPDCKNCHRDVRKKYFLDPKSLGLLQGLLTIEGQDVIINKMAEVKLKITADFYDSIIKDFNTIGESAYIIRQLSWIGLEDTYSESNYYSKAGIPAKIEDLYDLLEKYREKALDVDMQAELRKEFQEIAVRLKLYSKRSENDIGISKMNQILKDLNLQYQIESNNTNAGTTWIVIRV